MSLESTIVIYLTLYKLACLIVGLSSIYMGYRLFVKDIYTKAGDLDVNFNNSKIALKKAAPGTFFSLFGAAVIISTISSGLSFENLKKDKLNSLEENNKTRNYVYEDIQDTTNHLIILNPSSSKISKEFIDSTKSIKISNVFETKFSGNGSNGDLDKDDDSQGRKMIKKPNLLGISDIDCKICFNLIIEQNGNVVYAQYSDSKSTCISQEIIVKVKNKIINECKFERVIIEGNEKIQKVFELRAF